MSNVIKLGGMVDVNQLVKKYSMDIDEKIPREHSAKFQYDILLGHFSNFDSLSHAVEDHHAIFSGLMLSHYLATWGMFRGSSNLGNANTFFMVHLLKKLLNPKDGILIPLIDKKFESFDEKDIPALAELLDKVKLVIFQSGISATDTLVSKVLLGVWGQVPAYDRYFKDGIRRINVSIEEKIPRALTARGLVLLSRWAKQFEWSSVYASKEFGDSCEYTLAKKVDMALFTLGRETANQRHSS